VQSQLVQRLASAILFGKRSNQAVKANYKQTNKSRIKK